MLELKGRLKGAVRDFEGEGVQITFDNIKGLNPAALDAIREKDLRLTVKEWREKRTLDANGYYWVLLGRLAEVLKLSRPRAHNLLLRWYGVDEVIDGQIAYIVLPNTPEAEKKALESETYHLRPLSETRTGKDGRSFRTWVMLKGSRDMDTKEFSRLLDGLVAECQNAGIETDTPEQIERMKYLYEVNHSK